MSFDIDISKRIKEVREAKRMTQAQVADKLSIERSNYHRFENRDKKLTFEQIENIASALGVTLKELIFGEEDQSKQKLLEKIQDLEAEIKACKKQQHVLDEQISSMSDLNQRYRIMLDDERNLKYQQMTLLGEKMIRRIFEGRDTGQSKDEVNDAINDYIDEIVGGK